MENREQIMSEQDRRILLQREMIRRRTDMHLTRRQMGRKCQCTEALISIIEDDSTAVSHYRIVRRIAKAYEMTLDEAQVFVPPEHRYVFLHPRRFGDFHPMGGDAHEATDEC